MSVVLVLDWWGEAPERGQDIGNTLSRKCAFYIPILGQSENVWFPLVVLFEDETCERAEATILANDRHAIFIS